MLLQTHWSIAYCAKRKKEKNEYIEKVKAKKVGKIKDRLKEIRDKKLLGLAVRARCMKELRDEK